MMSFKVRHWEIVLLERLVGSPHGAQGVLYARLAVSNLWAISSSFNRDVASPFTLYRAS